VQAEFPPLLLAARGDLGAVLRAAVLPQRHRAGDDRPEHERVHEPAGAAEAADEADPPDRPGQEEHRSEDEQRDARDVVEDVGHTLAQPSAPVLVVHP
jgi:hypothetical protein